MGSGIPYTGQLLDGLDYKEFNITYYLGICSVSSSSFPFPLPFLSWLIMVENYSKRSLLLVSPLTLHISIGRSMLKALMALLESALCPVIPMLWATIFVTPRTQL